MDKRNIHGIIAVSVTLLAVGGIMYTVHHFINKNPSTNVNSSESNFDLLQKNTGLKANKDNIVIATFNNGKNSAQFYTNNRIIIFDENNKVFLKGTYSDGGKTIQIDTGKQVSSQSVWNNLLNII